MGALKLIAVRIVCLGVAFLAGYAALDGFWTGMDAISTGSITLYVGYRSSFAEFPYDAAEKPVFYFLTLLKTLAGTIGWAGLAAILGYLSVLPVLRPGATRELPLHWGSVTGRIWFVSFGVWVGLGFVLPMVVAVQVFWEGVG